MLKWQWYYIFIQYNGTFIFNVNTLLGLPGNHWLFKRKVGKEMFKRVLERRINMV